MTTRSLITLVALLRLHHAARSRSPKTYFLLIHAIGAARASGHGHAVNLLTLSEQNLVTSYRLNAANPAFSEVESSAILAAQAL